MNNSLLIADYIYSALSTLTTNVFPVVAEQGTNGAYIVYRRVGLNDNTTKDGWSDDVITYEITAYSPTYKEGLNLINNVRNSLTTDKTAQSYKITDFAVIGSTEDYASDYYIQTITYQITVTK